MKLHEDGAELPPDAVLVAVPAGELGLLTEALGSHESVLRRRQAYRHEQWVDAGESGPRDALPVLQAAEAEQAAAAERLRLAQVRTEIEEIFSAASQSPNVG